MSLCVHVCSVTTAPGASQPPTEDTGQEGTEPAHNLQPSVSQVQNQDGSEARRPCTHPAGGPPSTEKPEPPRTTPPQRDGPQAATVTRYAARGNAEGERGADEGRGEAPPHPLGSRPQGHRRRQLLPPPNPRPNSQSLYLEVPL